MFKNGDKVKLNLFIPHIPGIYLEDMYVVGTVVDDRNQDSLEIDLPPSANLKRWWIQGKYLKFAERILQKGTQLYLWEVVHE